MLDSYSSFEDSLNEIMYKNEPFSPGSSSTPKKNYKCPQMPLFRPQSKVNLLDTSMQCQMNTLARRPQDDEILVKKLPVPVFDIEEKFGCKICSKSFYHQSALEVHVLLHTSTLPRKQIAKQAGKVKLRRNPSRDSGHASAEDSETPVPKSPVAFNSSPEQYIHRFELNLTSLDDKKLKKLKKQKSKSTKQYACSICGKGFNKKTSMRIHQTKRHVHTREFLIFV